MEYLTFIIIWCIWCCLHSSLISIRATTFFKRSLKDNYRYFRLAYNGFALVSLIPVMAFSQSMKGVILFSWDGTLLVPWFLLWALTLFFLVLGYRAYDMGQFSGISQAMADPSDSPGSPPDHLSTKGILGITRHPWYLAALIFLWIRATDIHLSMVVENVILCLYLYIGIRLEERKLIRQHGDQYLDYQKRVSSLIPFKWFFSQFQRKG
jgi:protein-S-isoprenylcysteine O-methyltransferase Ste14